MRCRPGWSGRVGLCRQHPDHVIGALHVGKDARHGLEFRVVGVPMNLGHRVADDDHPVVVFDTFANRGGDADVVTPTITQVFTPRFLKIVSSGVLAKPPKPFLMTT